MELQNVAYQFWDENTEFKIPNVRCVGLFSQSIVLKTEELKTLQFLHSTKIKPVEVSVNFSYTLETSEWCFQGHKREHWPEMG